MEFKVKELVQRWVHIRYSRDLQELGYEPSKWGGWIFDAFTLTHHEDWTAFKSLYDDDDEPRLFEHEPNVFAEPKFPCYRGR